MENLEESDLFENVFDLISSSIFPKFELDGDQLISDKFNEKEIYCFEIYKTITKIIKAYTDLEINSIFLNGYSTNEYYTANKLNETVYIQYHFEYHFLKVSTIVDQVIRLASEIYKLGILPKSASLKKLNAASLKMNPKSILLINEFSVTISEIKKKRNEILHLGEFSDARLTKIQIIERVAQFSKNEVIKKLADEHKIKIAKLNIDSILHFVNGNNRLVSDFLVSIFDTFNDEYLLQIDGVK